MSVSISSPIGTSALRNPVAVGSNRSSILRMLEKSGGGRRRASRRPPDACHEDEPDG